MHDHAKPFQLSLTLSTQWIIATQTPLLMKFSRQEYWSGLPSPLLSMIPGGTQGSHKGSKKNLGLTCKKLATHLCLNGGFASLRNSTQDSSFPISYTELNHQLKCEKRNGICPHIWGFQEIQVTRRTWFQHSTLDSSVLICITQYQGIFNLLGK